MILILALALAPGACTLVGYPGGAPAPPDARTGGEQGSGDASGGSGTRPETRDINPNLDEARDFTRDRPPRDADEVDLAAIPDAVPRAEPRASSGNMREYEVFGRTYRVLESSEGYEAEGLASWYGMEFQGRPTSSGEPFDVYAMTAAHRTLPPTYLEVTNLQNGRRVVLRVNDRGPFHDEDRILDLSYAAAWKLGIVESGTARVRIRALEPASGG
jgi:rare lipoprotein A